MYDAIGDVHGCVSELKELLDKLGYKDNGKFYFHPDNRILISVGDIVSRGPDSLGVISIMRNMTSSHTALLTIGNHDEKIKRYLMGNKVKLTHGDDKTVEEINNSNIDKIELLNFLSSLPYFLSLDNENLIVTHASFKDNHIKEDGFSKRVRDLCLFGPTNGFNNELGIPNRIEWVSLREKSSPLIIYGHSPYLEVRIENGTIGVDTGCVYGNKLSAYSYPEGIITSVNAKQSYSGKVGEWSPQRKV